eukprot:TRINITY_DN3870_c0_g1_i1.p1 TRINITY_DN3870_c0_g1~~TRINITY_DN3870_c0_g1_i1.p1  ORF type:complete len:184 (+),score=49.13 TRINITY_DN3870_c0_g1_i1:64-615(+)
MCIRDRLTPGPNLHTFPWQRSIIRRLTDRLSEILLRVREEKNALELKRELKITVDPWDHYFIFDSEYFMKLLITSRELNTTQMILLVSFVLRIVELELSSQFKDSPEKLVEELFKFAANFKEYDDGKDILTYIEHVFTQRGDDEVHVDAILEGVSRLVEIFTLDLKMKGRFEAFKKDYLPGDV